ncbi:unnamed protein product [Closterium sp. NIES-53]
MSAPNTSAPSKSASSMASGGGEAAPFRQMSTEEHWWWGTPERLMTNWHGQWRCWKPLESTDAIRSFKSVRKFWATSPDRSSFAHMVSRTDSFPPSLSSFFYSFPIPTLLPPLPPLSPSPFPPQLFCPLKCQPRTLPSRHALLLLPLPYTLPQNDFNDEQGEVPKFRPPIGVQWDMLLGEHSPPFQSTQTPPLHSPLALSPTLSFSPPLLQNDFYDEQGEVPKFRPPVGVQWDMSLAEHSLPDGNCHVAVGTARRHSVSREGDGVWGPLEVGDGAGIIKPFVEEFFFSHSECSLLLAGTTSQVDTHQTRACNLEVGDGAGGIKVPCVEEISSSLTLPDHLPPVPALDDKTMVGTRTTLTRNLMVQERENVSWAEEWSPNSTAAAAAAAASASDEKSAAADAAAAGFMGRVPEGDEERYVVFALPHGVVVCAPRSPQLVAGRPFVLSVSWVVGEGEVKRITATWGANGGFEKVEGEWYRRQA